MENPAKSPKLVHLFAGRQTGRKANGIEHNYKQSLAEEYKLTRGVGWVSGIAANERAQEQGLGNFNFLATNSKPQIASTNTQAETKGGVHV